MTQKRFVLLRQDGQFLSINEGHHWISVPEQEKATVFSEIKANNILKNMIKPGERENWRTVLFSDCNGEETVSEETVEAEPAERRTVRKHGVKKPEPARVCPARKHAVSKEQAEKTEGLIDEWIQRANEMKEGYEQLIQRKKDLAAELRQVSAEICDLEHFIEFNSLNSGRENRIYHRLRDCLIRRRKIKDELMCITIFLKAEPHNIMNGNLARQFSGLHSREYAPRVLQELFEEKKKS